MTDTNQTITQVFIKAINEKNIDLITSLLPHVTVTESDLVVTPVNSKSAYIVNEIAQIQDYFKLDDTPKPSINKLITADEIKSYFRKPESIGCSDENITAVFNKLIKAKASTQFYDHIYLQIDNVINEVYTKKCTGTDYIYVKNALINYIYKVNVDKESTIKIEYGGYPSDTITINFK
jgi:hypothetical protein